MFRTGDAFCEILKKGNTNFMQTGGHSLNYIAETIWQRFNLLIISHSCYCAT